MNNTLNVNNWWNDPSFCIYWDRIDSLNDWHCWDGDSPAHVWVIEEMIRNYNDGILPQVAVIKLQEEVEIGYAEAEMGIPSWA